MAIVTATNTSSPNVVKWASTDADVYDRATQMAGLAENFDLHDHDSGKNLGVKRLQTTAAPTAAGHVQVTGDAFQWWGATAGAVRSAVNVEGTQTISGGKVFSGGITVSAGGALVTGNSTVTGDLTVSGAVSAGTNGSSFAGTTFTGTITMTTAASRLIPGATSFAVRNTANSADNLLVTNAGNATVLGNLTVGTNGSSLASTSVSGGLTVSTGGLTVTAGGLTVTAGGAVVTAGGLQVTGGNIGVGGAPDASAGVYLPSTLTLTTGVNQYGVLCQQTANSSATTSGTGVYAGVRTAATAFTMTNAYGVYVPVTVKGAGSTITNNYGLYVENQAGIGGTVNATAVFAGGKVFVGGTTNANLTQGLTLQQGGADDEILTLKSTDVAHGMTTPTETDSYGTFAKGSATGGILSINGYSTTNYGVYVSGNATTTDTSKTTSGTGPIYLTGSKKSGTSTTTLGATDNLVVMATGSTAHFIFQADGSAYEDVGTAWTNFSTHDDVGLLTRLSLAASRPDDPIHALFREFAEVNRDELQALDIIHFNDDGHHFLNRSKTQMLLIGAVMQTGRRVAQLEAELASVKALGAGG